jgi:hypothetical protein
MASASIRSPRLLATPKTEETMTNSPKKDPSRKPRLSVPETARTLKVMPQHVYNLIAGGVLEAEKVNHRWQVSRDSVEQRIRTVNHAMATTRRHYEEVSEPESRAAP